MVLVTLLCGGMADGLDCQYERFGRAVLVFNDKDADAAAPTPLFKTKADESFVDALSLCQSRDTSFTETIMNEKQKSQNLSEIKFSYRYRLEGILFFFFFRPPWSI